jgi:hypothetical protein
MYCPKRPSFQSRIILLNRSQGRFGNLSGRGEEDDDPDDDAEDDQLRPVL